MRFRVRKKTLKCSLSTSDEHEFWFSGDVQIGEPRIIISAKNDQEAWKELRRFIRVLKTKRIVY